VNLPFRLVGALLGAASALLLPGCDVAGRQQQQYEERNVERPIPANYGTISLARETRVVMTSSVEPETAVALHLPARTADSLSTNVVERIADRLRREGRDPAIFTIGTGAAAGPEDVLVEQEVRPGQRSGSYTLILIARQGESSWSSTIERTGGVNPEWKGIADENGRPTGNAKLESLLMDSRTLAERLTKALVIDG
jgi:hypothetical protein